MKNKFLVVVFATLFLMPCVLRAEEVEIQLMEVVSMTPLPGDDPLDGPEQSGNNPTRPNDFHATINGHFLSVVKEEPSIPFAQVSVVNASTGNIVLMQNITTSLSENIANNGVYVLHIETDGGALVGQFVVQ